MEQEIAKIKRRQELYVEEMKNAHILRYLKQVIELFERKGAENFLEYLIKINNDKKALEAKGAHKFSTVEIERTYSELLDNWEKEELEFTKA